MDHLKSAREKHAAGDLPGAYALYLQAVREDANLREAWINLGEALKASAKTRLAISCFRKAFAIGDDPHIRVALGELLRENLEYDEAEQLFRGAVLQEPGLARAWYNLALISIMKEDGPAALIANAQALRFEPAVSDILYQKALIELARGNYADGFRDYEARLGMRAEFLHMPEAPWRGESLAGKTLHIYGEQGLGDVLQFARWLPQVPSSGEILVTVPKELRRLFDLSFRDPRFSFQNHGTRLRRGDFSVAIGSLPHLMNVRKIIGDPYLTAPAVAKKIAAPIGARRRIGFCWAGRTSHQSDHLRSANPEVFIENLNTPGTQLFSLQFAPVRVDPSLVGDMGMAIDLAPQISDFADSAALVSQLDAVVSVDTSIVHLCGALGIRCHVIIAYGALDWRWGQKKTTTDWYDSVVIHRQAQGESWADVLKRVATFL